MDTSTSNATKQCRACTDFKSWFRSQKAGSSETSLNPPRKTNNITEEKSAAAATDVTRQEGTKANSANGTTTTSTKTNTSQNTIPEHDEDPPLWGKAAKHGCPVDSVELGKGTWGLLHTVAANYPDNPSSQQREDMSTFIALFSKLYPCPPCAQDFREWLKTNTPPVGSQSSLSRWFCDAHNEVNRKLGKPIFDCNLVDERWRDGWKDGSCD